MKLYALPEDTLNKLFDTLRELPFKDVNPLFNEINKNLKTVVDSNNVPVELPTTTETNTQEVTASS